MGNVDAAGLVAVGFESEANAIEEILKRVKTISKLNNFFILYSSSLHKRETHLLSFNDLHNIKHLNKKEPSILI
ncbi:hypothetical protein GCM10023260_09750 [Bartonella acomydis]|uniref:Uncharacterized protein n=1 Tax=Bartonella acomydis TaxID=686234 RepID=A0ABP9MSM4_9HYPH